ncbi:anthranilate phosphoribosyltransferase [Shewanella baltica]|uniref:anthranilate phosphoribosyltransferase n=1 Tax=Shewanella baltica TaxID=62322 RepID=UPI00217DFBD1|nr:anthranilate phosphoribosyltransferase [Shewanella baltica]MCS6159063.1 anthranilate phosphoribosyltransferase [Shewanella baltica]
MIRETLKHLVAKQALSSDEIISFINDVNCDDVSEANIAAFLMGLTSKGVTTNETVAIVRAMNAHLIPVRPKITEDLLDTCGTGGGLSTFNISTATAIVCAAAGIPVAKHGSRSLSSPSGSADVLEALGVKIDLQAPMIEKMIEEIGLAFIHAPHFNPVMKRILPVETTLGIKTIFYSLIGPLVNPASAPRHLLGVYRSDLQQMTVDAARELGLRRAMVVHGLDGLDEVSLLGRTCIHEIGTNGTSIYEITPEDVGLTRCRLHDIRTLGPRGNAELIQQIFSGKMRGAPRDAILLNSAGALILGGRATNFHEGISLAGHLLDSGLVARKLHDLIEASHSFPVTQPLKKENKHLRTAERTWQGMLAASPDGILIIGSDGIIEQANLLACAQLGIEYQEVSGRSYGQLLSAETALVHLDNIKEAISTGKAIRWDDSLDHSHLGLTAIPIDDGSGVILICRDLTQQMHIAASEKDKRARLKTLIETLPDLIWLMDTNGCLLNCNSKFENLVGLAESQLKGHSIQDILPQTIAKTLQDNATQVLWRKAAVHSREWFTYAADKHREYVEIILTPFIDYLGDIKGIMCVARDVTAFRLNEEELERQKLSLRELLYTDKLTGLPSRQAQLEHIEALAANNSTFSIIGISLNRYSRVISNFGLAMSELLIIKAVSAIAEVIPEGCQFGSSTDIRFSIVVANVVDPNILADIAKKIIDRMCIPLKIDDATVFVNISIGIASYPTHGNSTDLVIRNTYIALTEAEQIDGSAMHFFESSMLTKVQQLQWLDQNLRLAFEKDQFELHYQPKVNLTDNTIHSVEALIRWVHPERGNIRPDEFINRCEANGLIIPIGNWVINTAAQQAAIWCEQGNPLRIAINLSVSQLADPELISKLRTAQTQASGLLDIEITESCLISNQAGMLEFINQCRELKFGIHLDDFGTGYSSLSVLASLPLTNIKLDKIFVQRIGKEGNGEPLLKSMISMAKELGIAVVAEGVETQSQADFLKEQRVLMAQGWLYAPAMKANTLNAWRTEFLTH